MNEKYVIRNCPCYQDNKGMNCISPNGYYFCQYVPDCKLKQIVQVCNEYSDKWEDCDFSNGLSEEILKLLDIQECE
jgi:hypothetical protein